MTDSNQFDATMLVLKMVGGSLDGKLLPISTQKCFLTGGEKNNHDQCAIIRGPSGTAIKSSESIFVNDHPDTLHWLSEGDTIRIGQTTMIVQQLGCFGESTVSTTAAPNAIGGEPQVQTQTAVEATQLATTASFEQTTTSSDFEEAAEPTDTYQSSQVDSNDTETEPTESSDSHSELRDFLSNVEQPSEPQDLSTPEAEVESSNQEEISIEPNLSNELLERALNSLKNPSDTPIEELQEQAQDSSAELSTEQNVDQQLDEIQNHLESQIQNYDSLSAVEPPAQETDMVSSESDFEPTTTEESVAVPQLPEAPAEPANVENLNSQQQSIEEIMNRLRNSDVASVEDPSQPEEPVVQEEPQHEPAALEAIDLSVPEVPQALESSIEETAHDAATTEPNPDSDSNEGSPQPQSIQDVMNLLGAAAAEPSADDEIESIQATEPVIESTTMDHEVQVVEPAAEETQAETEPTTPAVDENDTSVAAVLARMQSAGKLSDYNMSAENEATPNLTAQSVTEPIRQPSEPETPSEEVNEGGDVQDYMNQLFQRLRGSDAPESVVQKPEPKETETPAAPVEATTPMEPVKEVERILTPTEYVPKQQAPEVKSDLEAMRQLANQQKDAAVQISSSKKSQLQQTINQCVAVACFVISVFLGRMASSITDPLAIVSFGCGVASLMGFFRYAFALRKGKEEDEELKEEGFVEPPEAVVEQTVTEAPQ